MIKWPEPVADAYAPLVTLNAGSPSLEERRMVVVTGVNVYTEAQLKQAVRDALEEAVGLCDDDNTANAIRALIEEIE